LSDRRARAACAARLPPMSTAALLARGRATLILIFHLFFDWPDRNALVGNGLVLLAALCRTGALDGPVRIGISYDLYRKIHLKS